MSEHEHQLPIAVRTIATPLPAVPENLIQRRMPAEPSRMTPYERAIEAGDAGLIGTDGSGNDWEFSENLGAAALQALSHEEGSE
jgi:hypothetical protein